MKKKLIFQFLAMLLAMIVVTSCQKQILEQDQSDEVFLKSGSMDNAEKRYRLLVDSGLSDGFIQSYHYNDKGLADKFHISKPDLYSYSATMEYNENNLMSKAKAYVGTDEFDVVFTYNEDKLIKETWFYPGTTIISDYLVNTYNRKGQLVKRDDPPYELYTLYHYDDVGNCVRSEIFDYQGNLYFANEFEYTRKIKNPFASVTGLPVTWFFLDDIRFINRFTGLKGYYNDENGNQVVFYEWKSKETETRTGPQNYPIYQNSRDVVSNTWTDQVWKYENYSGKKELDENHPKFASFERKANPDAPGQIKFRSKTFKQDMKAMRLKGANEKKAVIK